MKNQSLKMVLLSALGISCLIGFGTMMRHEVRFYANEAIGENGTYNLTLNSETSVVDGTVKTNLGNNIHLGASEGVLFNDDSFVTLPTSSKVYSSSTGFEVIKSLQVFYEGSSLAYQLSKTSGDDTSLTTFDSGTKVYMLNQYQHFTLKNVGKSEAKVTKIVVEYYCGGSIEGNVYNYTVGDASYWDITTDENGVTTIVSNYDLNDENHKLAAFMTLKGVRMGVGTVAYDMDFSPQSATGEGNLKGFATNVYSESTLYGGDYISSGVLSSKNASVTDGRVLIYGFVPTGATKGAGWAHKSSTGGDANPTKDLNGTLFNTNEKHRIITEVENSITKGKVVTNYMETAGGLNTKSVSNADLSAYTGKCVGLQLHHKGISVSNVVITSLDEVDTIDRATSDTVAVTPTGTGTAEDPFLIESVANFMWFKEQVATNTSYCAKLMKDLDLGHTGTYTSMCSSTAPYTGTFDGNGHKITGVSNFFAPTLTSFFGYTTGATIKNLSLSVIFESTADKIAGLVTVINGGTISNCVLKGFVSGLGVKDGAGVGGIVCYGNAVANTLIDGCVNYASIKNSQANGNTFAAGIMASNNGVFGSVSNCKNYGCVYAKGNFVGGIVGLARANAANKVVGCKNFGDISGLVATNAQVSGIVGRCRVAISNCMTFKDCLINGALASTLPSGETALTQGYICNRETSGAFGTGNSLCDINGNPIA